MPVPFRLVLRVASLRADARESGADLRLFRSRISAFATSGIEVRRPRAAGNPRITNN
jgi:hypothetical protein